MKKVVLLSLALMGTCSSIHKSKMPLVPSPRKQKNANGNGGEDPLKVMATEFGSKGEMFFDSRAWLDSDCEDDFFSVNGDFTPSHGSSPNNQSSSLSTAYNKSISLNNFPDPDSEPSPTVRKKLADLFQETSQPNASDRKVETNTTLGLFSRAKTDQPWKGANSTSIGKSSPSRDIMKNQKAVQCCLPRPIRDLKGSRRQTTRQKDSVACPA